MIVTPEGKTAKTGVFIAVPTTEGMVSSEIAELLACSMALNYDEGCPFYFMRHQTEGLRPVELARNVLVRSFLSTECTRLLFLDQDTRPTPDAIFRLLKHDADIVSGVYMCADKPKDALELRLLAFEFPPDDTKGFKPILPKEGETVRDADGCIMGATIIHRRVFEDPRMKLPMTWVDPYGDEIDATTDSEQPTPYFRTVRKASGQCYMTEDLDFCLRARKLGYTLKIDWTCMPGHVKTLDLNEVARLVVNKMAEAKGEAAA